MGGASGGAGANPSQIYDPVTGTYGASLPASDNPMANTGPINNWRQNLMSGLSKAGQYANKLQPLISAIPGSPAQQGQQGQQQQPRYPVNFNTPAAPYIPPPGAGSNNNYGY